MRQAPSAFISDCDRTSGNPSVGEVATLGAGTEPRATPACSVRPVLGGRAGCPGALGRQQGGVGVKEDWGGGAWAVLGREFSPQPVQSLLHHLTRHSSEPRRAPDSTRGRAVIWGSWKGGQAVACPLQENQRSPCLPDPREHTSECLSQGRKEGEKGPERVSLSPLGESTKGWKEGFRILSFWKLGAEGRGKGLRPGGGFNVPTALEADKMVWGKGQGTGALSQSLFPCKLLPMPVAHPVLKGYCHQTLSPAPSYQIGRAHV